MATNSKSTKFKSARYDSMKLFYYRTRLRLSNTYDSIKSKWSSSLPQSNCSDTDLTSDSDKHVDFVDPEIKIQPSIRISEREVIKRTSNCNKLLLNEVRNHEVTRKRKYVRRKRRSSRTRSRYYSDTDLSLEFECGNCRPGTGDQVDTDNSYDEDEQDKEECLVQEPTSISQTSAQINCLSDEECSKDEIPETGKISEPNEPPVATLKLKTERKSSTSTLNTKKVNKPSLPIKDETELMLREALGLELEGPAKHQKDAKKSKQIFASENQTVKSLISRFQSPRSQAESKQKMTVGFKFTRDNTVRKHTCMQELKNMLGISDKLSRPKIPQRNTKKTEKSAKKEVNIQDNKNPTSFLHANAQTIGPYLISNTITTNNSGAESNSPFAKYFASHPDVVQFKNISHQENVTSQVPRMISSYTPKTAFTRQFASLIQTP